MNLFLRSVIAGAALAVVSFAIITNNQYDKRVFAALLGLAAVASLGMVWKKETGSRDAGVFVIIASVVSLAAFFLADPIVLGFRRVAALTGSFAVAGLLALLKSRS